MSQVFRISSGVLGGAAAALALGAIQFAFGSDLRTPNTDSPIAVSTVNRAAKADRVSKPAVSPNESVRIVSFRVHSLADTSVMMRIPIASTKVEALKLVAAPSKPSVSRTSTVACEPPVSVLTEVAKLLQPGRCIT